MTKENGRDGEETWDPTRVSEEQKRGTSPNGAGRIKEDNWSASGTEDPAFLIKPSEEK